MPLINGQKMACEPCIRGHRSTKCNHAKDRLMVPVRKPGRPLSVCPHPPNKPCGCGGVTAAIPRTQKCGCGDGAAAIKAESPVANTPGSPTRRSFHVHKTGTKSISRIDPASLERHLNAHAPASWASPPVPGVSNSFVMPVHAPTSLPYQTPLSTEYQILGSAEYETPYMIPSQPQHVLHGSLPIVPQKVEVQKQQFSLGHGPAQAVSGRSAQNSNGISSCCAPAPASPSSSPRHTPTSSTASASSAVATATPSSCCSAKQPEAKLNGRTIPHYPLDAKPNGVHNGVHNGIHHVQVPSSDGAMISPFEQSLNVQQMFPTYFQQPGPVIYTFPPSYGTIQSPLQPAQWRQTMSATAFGDATPPNPIALPQNTGMQFTASEATGTSHLCSCGDSCSCIGCLAHPYNDATQEIVRSAMHSMLEQHPGEQTFANGVADDGSKAAGISLGEPASPQQAQTPSDASGISEDQAHLSANDFFFVTYDLNHCGGEMTSCPCGDDCQCVGCLIHNSSQGAQETGEDD